MTNKPLIITLTAIILLSCVYYLSFTFKARSIQKQATEYATDENGVLDAEKKRDYLDSLYQSKEPVYNMLFTQFTYKEVKEKELALGLDLQGGMHVTLEVSPAAIIQALSGNNNKPEFQKALELAQEKQKNSQENFVDLFVDSYREVEPNGKLALIFTNTSNQGQINYTSEDSEVIRFIRQEVNDAFDRAFNIIRTRIDKFGVANPNIQKLPGTNRILVELPGVDNPKRARKLLSGVAKLEFWEVWETQELGAYYQQFAAYLDREEKKKNLDKKPDGQKQPSELVAKEDGTETEEESPLLVAEDEGQEELIASEDENQADSTENTLLAEGDSTQKDTTASDNLVADTGDSTEADSSEALATETDSTLADTTANQTALAAQLMAPSYAGFEVKLQDTARVNEILSRPEVKSIFPSNVKFLYDVKPNEEAGTITLYPIKKGRGGEAPLDGDVIVDARRDFEGSNPIVDMQMNSTGAKVWRKLTAANVNRRIAVVLDNLVYSAPNVNGEIPNGSSRISGSFTMEEAKDLANVLKAGKLPAPTRIVEEATVGPSLGRESINQGLVSMLVGMGLVVIFMVLYYKSSGLIADVALLVNIFFIIGLLAQFGAVLTLPGMAGIVLTIGMSVDANVLIYERIREELANRKNLKNAINEGYQKAYSSIIDANATTFLTGVILYSFGSGPVKGFAVTLMIGIVCSLFSAIFITRLIIEFFTRKKEQSGVSFESLVFKQSFRNLNIRFIDLRKQAYIGSGALIGLGLILLIAQGLTLGVDFKGGRSYVVEFDEPVSVKEARAEVGQKFEESTEIKTFGGNNKLKITTTYLIDDESAEADQKVESQLRAGLEAFQDKNPKIVSFSKVGATIADDIANTSYLAVGFSLLVIFLYIFVRFQKWQYGLGALAALVHDVLIVIAFMGIAKLLGFSYEVDQVFIAAMLTVVGYSINDTVVVFDRIREFAGDTKGSNFPEELNKAINATLSRTVMTSSTTLVVILILFLFGGEVLSGFSFALLIGILVGTYSSVFIASPIVLDISLLQRQSQEARRKLSRAKAK